MSTFDYTIIYGAGGACGRWNEIMVVALLGEQENVFAG